MNKILSATQLDDVVKKLHREQKQIVLVGGCFDILHRGHIDFLQRAKERGDCLLVLLESDTSIKKRKGEKRPVHKQDIRASILAALPTVDYIVHLPSEMSDADYDTVVLTIKPAIIATTKGDPGRKHKLRQAQLTGARVVDVIDRVPAFATSKLAEQIIV